MLMSATGLSESVVISVESAEDRRQQAPAVRSSTFRFRPDLDDYYFFFFGLAGATSGTGRDFCGETSGATSGMGLGCFCGATSGMGRGAFSGATSGMGRRGATSGIGRRSGAISGMGPLLAGATSGIGLIPGATSGIG
jgi:hypothetical protein